MSPVKRCFMFGGDVPLAWAHCLCSLASPPPVLNWGLRPCRDVTVQAPAAHGPVIRCRTMMPFSSQARRSFFSKKNKVLEASPDFCCGFFSPSGVWFVPALQRCSRTLTEMPAPWIRRQTLPKAAMLLDAGLQGVCL